MKKSRVIVGIGGIIVLAVAYYAISPLFQRIVVDDAVPAETSTATTTPASYDVSEQVLSNDSYAVIGTAGHPASGIVRLIDSEEGVVIRYEDFSTINGPNLHLYLAKDLDAQEYVDLGPIRGTEGNINYVVPEDVNIDVYRYVMYWCVPFGVLFNYADIGMK